jgi:hypothetical protein
MKPPPSWTEAEALLAHAGWVQRVPLQLRFGEINVLRL